MPNIIIKNCKHHGDTEFVFEKKRNCYRCKKCKQENVDKCRRRTKEKLVDEFGGECEICGYSRWKGALQFHHVIEETKEFGISRGGYTRSYAKNLREAKKCAMLCANCHQEVTDGVIQVPEHLRKRVLEHLTTL